MEMYTDNIKVSGRALELMLRRLHHAQLKRICVLSMYCILKALSVDQASYLVPYHPKPYQIYLSMHLYPALHHTPHSVT